MVCRESPLRYTEQFAIRLARGAMVCRESPLRYTRRGGFHAASRRYGLPGIAAEVHCVPGEGVDQPGYGLPGIAAEVHYVGGGELALRGYGLPGIAAEVHYRHRLAAGGGAMVCRESPLRYTFREGDLMLPLRYGLPGIAAEVH